MANIPVPRHVQTPMEAAWRVLGYCFGDGNPPDSGRGLSSNDYQYILGGQFQTECERCAVVAGGVFNVDWKRNSGGDFICKRSWLHAALGIPSTIDIYHGVVTGIAIPRKGLQAFLASLIEGEGGGSVGTFYVMDEARGGSYCPRIPGVITLMNQHGLTAFQSGGNSAGCGKARVPDAKISAFPLPLITTGRYHASSLADWPEDSDPDPPDTTPPPVPGGLTAIPGNTTVTLSWNTVSASDLASYRLYRNGNPVYTGSTPGFSDTGRTNNVTYLYTVASRDTTGNESSQSAAVSATPTEPDVPPDPDHDPPPIPTGLTADPGDNQVILTWNPIVGVPDFLAYRIRRNGDLVYNGVGTTFTDVTAVNDVLYAYAIHSRDTSFNDSEESPVVFATPQDEIGPDPGDTTPPQPPAGIALTPSQTSVEILWGASPSTDVVAYLIYRNGISVTTVVAPSGNYTDIGLEPATPYTYSIFAVDENGNLSSTATFAATTTLLAPVPPPPDIDPEDPGVFAFLGCATQYDVYVADRSGEILLRPLPFTGLSWERVVDDISTASIDMDMTNTECCEALSGLIYWAYEIVVFRDGRRVWTGPLQDIVVQGESVSLKASDKLAWPQVRLIWNPLSFPDPGVDLAEIFNAVGNGCMAPDNLPGLVFNATPTGIRGIREYETNPPQIAWDALSELGRTGVDFTMVGPTLVAGSFVVPTPAFAILTDQCLAEPASPTLLGSNFSTYEAVTGDPNQNLLATYGGTDVSYGLVARLSSEDDIDDQESLAQNAKSKWELRSKPLFAPVDLVLDPGAPTPIELLVPGTTADLRLNEGCFPIVGRHRLRRLSVEVHGGDGLEERVTTSWEPVGTELVT